MKYKGLYLRLTKSELKKALVRYHFVEKETLFYDVYEKLRKQVRPVLYYQSNFPSENHTLCMVSLGKAPDELYSFYEENAEYLSTYAVECLSLELLSKSYQQIADILHRDTRLFVKDMHFCDLEEINKILPVLEERASKEKIPFIIKKNEVSLLFPSKTVLFIAKLGKTACRNFHDCKNCGKKDCIFREEIAF